MNWIMLQEREIDAAGRAVLEDRRARHVIDVLQSKVGHRVRVGVVNGAKGEATLTSIGDVRIGLQCDLGVTADRPRLNLLLALPRPKVMKRLWAPLASLGLDRIVLTNAEKVERVYFDTHWIQKEHYSPLLMTGLEQAGETALPEVLLRKRLKPFVEDELESLFSRHDLLLAEPGEGAPLHAFQPGDSGRVAVAIGPEGGWSDHEKSLLKGHGFRPVTLGRRTLRTDTACVAILASLQAILEERGP